MQPRIQRFRKRPRNLADANSRHSGWNHSDAKSRQQRDQAQRGEPARLPPIEMRSPGSKLPAIQIQKLYRHQYGGRGEHGEAEKFKQILKNDHRRLLCSRIGKLRPREKRQKSGRFSE